MKRIGSLILLLHAGLSFGHSGEEASVNVGPDQGVIAFEKGQGFKLSPEATRRFKIRTIPVNALPFDAPRSSIVETLKERNLFRIRQGFFLRIDFKEISRTSGNIRVASPTLQIGDEIVTSGLGFLRIVELGLGGGEHTDEHSDGPSEKEEPHHD